jgi:ATP synthase protein I
MAQEVLLARAGDRSVTDTYVRRSYRPADQAAGQFIRSLITMLANYAQIVRRSTFTTAAIGAVMAVISVAIGGPKGLLGAVLGIALVAVFFAISVFAVGWAARKSPQAMMITAMTTYIAKILLLLFFVVRFAGTTMFNSRLFGLTALACILAWSASQVYWSMRLKMPYVEPSGR